MDHEQAMKIQASERYLLDELSPEERNDFEEHYFICTKCADEVRSAFALADNAKSVLKAEMHKATPHREVTRPRWSFDLWAWLRPAVAAPVAAVLLLGVTLYQSAFVIPRLQRDLATATKPQAVPSVVARAATRGEDTAVAVSEHDQFLQLVLDINPTIPVSSYTSEVYDAAGGLRFTVPSPAPANGGSLNLLLPVAGLQSGRYTVRVKPTGDEYSFVLQLK